MSGEEPESFIDKISRQQSLVLRVAGGRLLIENAQPDGVDRSKIELNCWWSPSLLGMMEDRIRIGDARHKPITWDEDGFEVVDGDAEDEIGWSLLDCPVELMIHRSEDGWLADNKARSKDDPIIGRFSYSAPIKTSDGVVNQERPTIHAWIALGPENFKFLRDRLTNTEVPDFDLGITVEFPRGTVETGWVKSTVKWDGKEPLPVTGASFVWKRGEWDSDAPRERRWLRKSEPEEHVPPREHVELLQSVSRLETAVTKLTTPVWIAAVAAVVAVFFIRS